MTLFLRILGLFGILLIVGANGFDKKSLLSFLFIPLFFIGKPWYKYLPTKSNENQ